MILRFKGFGLFKENKNAFHKFCIDRGIPLNLELLFVNFFKGYITDTYGKTTKHEMTYLLSSLEEHEIKTYWQLFVVDLKNKINNAH